MGLNQEITQVLSRYRGKAAASHYVPPNSLLPNGRLEEMVREILHFLLEQGMQPGELV